MENKESGIENAGDKLSALLFVLALLSAVSAAILLVLSVVALVVNGRDTRPLAEGGGGGGLVLVFVLLPWFLVSSGTSVVFAFLWRRSRRWRIEADT